eukprot:PhM_4_TR14894/c0_g1_i1/m.49956
MPVHGMAMPGMSEITSITGIMEEFAGHALDAVYVCLRGIAATKKLYKKDDVRLNVLRVTHSGAALALHFAEVVVVFLATCCLCFCYAVLRWATGDARESMIMLSLFFAMGTAMVAIVAPRLPPIPQQVLTSLDSNNNTDNKMLLRGCNDLVAQHEVAALHIEATSRCGPAGLYGCIEVSVEGSNTSHFVAVHEGGAGFTVVTIPPKNAFSFDKIRSKTYPVGYHSWNQRHYSPIMASDIEAAADGSILIIVAAGTAVPGWGFNMTVVDAQLEDALRSLGLTLPILQNQSLALIGRRRRLAAPSPTNCLIAECLRRYGAATLQHDIT